jgi:hypothetical protein
MRCGFVRECLGWLLCAGGVLAAIHLPAPAGSSLMAQTPPERKSDAALAEEHQQRFKALGPKDVDGHYALAQWCNEQGQYQLAAKQAQYVLKLDPKHVDARLLYTAALRKAEEQPRGKAGQQTGAAGLVTKADIQRLRFIELLDFQVDQVPPSQRESVSVRFGKGVLPEFLDAMGEAPEFAGRAGRQRFYSLTPTQQLQVLRAYSGSTYLSRIEILGDPVVFRRFKPVETVLERGCAANGCHGGDTPAKPFALRTSFHFPEQSLYTQFLILDRVAIGRDRLIDRDHPSESLILQYGLPSRYGRLSHSTPIKPLYPLGLDDPNYRMVFDWIGMLRVPRPITGISLEGYPEPPPAGAQIAAPGEKGEAATRPAPVLPR